MAIRSDHFTVANVAERLKGLKVDPWRKYFTLKQKYTRTMKDGRVCFFERGKRTRDGRGRPDSGFLFMVKTCGMLPPVSNWPQPR